MIACLGELILDILLQRRTGHGVEEVVERLSVQPGGSAANTAAWLAYQGVPTAFLGAAGTDLVGDMLVEDLRRRGVYTAVSRLPHQRSGVLLIEVLPNGTTRPAGRRGANNELGLSEIQRAMLADATWLHLTAYAFYAEASRAPVLAAVALARAGGARVSLDLGAAHLVSHIGFDPYVALIQAVAPDLLLANQLEADLLAGSGGDALSALAALSPIAVLKRGAAGCVAKIGGETYEQSAVPASEIDPIGAGDAFAAGMIAALQAGRTLADALRAAAALGAHCVALDGGRPPLDAARQAPNTGTGTTWATMLDANLPP